MIEFDSTFDSSSFAFNLKLIKKNLIVLKKVSKQSNVIWFIPVNSPKSN